MTAALTGLHLRHAGHKCSEPMTSPSSVGDFGQLKKPTAAARKQVTSPCPSVNTAHAGRSSIYFCPNLKHSKEITNRTDTELRLEPVSGGRLTSLSLCLLRCGDSGKNPPDSSDHGPKRKAQAHCSTWIFLCGCKRLKTSQWQ